MQRCITCRSSNLALQSFSTPVDGRFNVPLVYDAAFLSRTPRPRIMKITSRHARLHDAEELAIIEYSARKSDPTYDLGGTTLPLIAERWRSHLRRNLRLGNATEDAATLIAALGREDVGVISIVLPDAPKPRCALWAMYVRGGHQRKGVGTFLLRTLALQLQEKSIRELYVEKCDHESGLAFCRKHRAVPSAGLLCWYDVKSIHEPPMK
jgi:GNAT superfamily N-acetyltransferase